MQLKLIIEMRQKQKDADLNVQSLAKVCKTGLQLSIAMQPNVPPI